MDTRSSSVRKSIDKRNSIWSGTIRNALRRQSNRTVADVPNEEERDEIRTISGGKLKPGVEQNYAWID